VVPARDGEALNAPHARRWALWLVLGASLRFARPWGVCVKFASAFWPPGEIVCYRGPVGMLVAGWVVRAQVYRLRTRVPIMHFWRSLCGVLALGLWFYAIAGLPLASAVTLNYLSSVWMALFLLGGAASMLWAGFSLQGAALLLAVGLLAAVAQLLITRAFAIGSALSNAGLQYSGMLFASVHGVLLFGERLSWMAVAGMLQIVAAGLASTVLACARGAVLPSSES
jgi:drug/metabolite transporter (DMT)-like permease